MECLFEGFGRDSIHLRSGSVRAALRSPNRAVRAARWTNDNGEWKGIAVCEDSMAISQGVPAQIVWAASSSIISFEMNPFSGGTPAIEAAATVASVAVIGISAAKPPSCLAFRVPTS